MKKLWFVTLGALVLSVAMFGIGYWVGVKRMDRSMNFGMGYLSYSMNKTVISDARMDGILLDLLMKNDSIKATELLQKKYYGEVLMLEVILQNSNNLAVLFEGEPILAKQYAGEIQISAEDARSEAAKRLKRHPFQLMDEQGSDRLESLRQVGSAEK